MLLKYSLCPRSRFCFLFCFWMSQIITPVSISFCDITNIPNLTIAYKIHYQPLIRLKLI